MAHGIVRMHHIAIVKHAVPVPLFNLLSNQLIPTDAEVEEFAVLINDPAIYVGTPEFYHDMKAFGYWSLPLKPQEATVTKIIFSQLFPDAKMTHTVLAQIILAPKGNIL